MAEYKEHECAGGQNMLRLFKEAQKTTQSEKADARRCEGGTGFTFQSQKGSRELSQLLVLTMQPIRQRSMDLEHLAMTYKNRQR